LLESGGCGDWISRRIVLGGSQFTISSAVAQESFIPTYMKHGVYREEGLEHRVTTKQPHQHTRGTPGGSISWKTALGET
jgi:hypothetical protein